ncbi:uncharacterized protein LOC115268157 [Aedes albopictus]|uniref:Major facilitator superfamily (MFS) profile domain-containing protein n=1 Tax=Aedes albopictus TaxID=7160 RepID=A0ABM1YVD7_AEDAL
MGGCTEWCLLSRKNKMQTNSLLGGIATLALGGVFVGSTIFNIHLRLQGWASGETEAVVLFVIILFYVGAIIGSFIGAVLVDRLEKLALSRFYFVGMGIACILQVIAPTTIIVIGFARIIAGAAFGMAYLIVLVHGGEVLVRELRGVTMAAVNYILFVGILSHGAISPIVLSNYAVQPVRIVGIIGAMCILIAVAIGQFMSFESPIYLVRKNRDIEAIRTLMKLRLETAESSEIRLAYADIKSMLQEDSNTSRRILADGNWFPLLLTSMGKIAAVLSFNAAVNHVRLTVLDKVFNLEEYSISAVIIGAFRITFGIVFLFTVDKYGRKPQQALSTFLSGTLLLAMGVVYLITEHVYRNAVLAVFLIYDLIACAGVTLVPDIHLSEAFPTTKKHMSIAVVLMVENVAQVIILAIDFWYDYTDPEIYGPVLLACGLPMVMISVFLYQMLPETAKLSIRQSRAVFARNAEVFKSDHKPDCDSVGGRSH